MENVHLSTQIAESLASFSKQIHKTFEELERKAKQDTARSVADALEARNERDNANRLLHEAQMETQQWKQEVISLKGALKQAETTISHHLETIALLKRESGQWKDQSRNWQEHFLRVEQERCGLASKVEELNERLHNQSTMGMAPMTPISRYADHDETIAHLPLSPPEPESPSMNHTIDRPLRTIMLSKKTPTARPVRSQPSSSKQRSHLEMSEDDGAPLQPLPIRKSLPQSPPRRLESQTSATQSAPQLKLIRRVTAVVPVKQEEMDDQENSPDEEADDEDDGDYVPSESPVKRLTRRRSSKQAAKLIREPSVDASLDDNEEDEEDELMIISKDKFPDTHTTPSHKRRPPTPGPFAPSAKRRKNNTGPTPKTGTKKRN